MATLAGGINGQPIMKIRHSSASEIPSDEKKYIKPAKR